MGFFLTEAQATRARDRAKTEARPTKMRDLGGKGCDACPLKARWGRITSPRMPLSGNLKDPDILVLGEAPGAEEDDKGHAFIGPSGKLLREVIPSRDMSRLTFTNAARCRPQDNETPEVQAVHACSSHLEADVLKYNFKAILGVGGTPLHHFFPGASIMRVAAAKFVVNIGGKLLWYYPVYHPSFVLQNGGERGPAYSVFKADVKTFFKNVDKWRAPYIDMIKPEDVLLPNSLEEAETILARMKDPLGFDVETGTETKAILRPYKKGARILTAAFSDGEITMAFPVFHPDRPNNWALPFILRVCAERPWIAHNAAFELIWLLWYAQQKDRWWQPAPFEDSQAMARVYHERNSIAALDEVSRIHLGIDIKTITRVNAANIMNYTLEEILPYNGIDAWASARIYHRLRKRVGHEEQYLKFVDTIRSFSEMEVQGLHVDQNETYEIKAKWDGIATELELDAKNLYEVRQFELDNQIEFNIGSNDHVGAALVTYAHIDLAKSPKGKNQYLTGEDELKLKAPDNPLAKIVLGHREAIRMASTYCDAVIEACNDNVDGLLHPSYSTLLTHTTRSSSSGDTNIQNWPQHRQAEVRKQVMAPPGHIFLKMDKKQLEARVFGMASKDQALCSSIISGEDIHSYWLHQILDRCPEYIVRLMQRSNTESEKTAIKEGRNIIKTDFVFASFYGSIAESCADRTGIPLSIVKEVLHYFWQRYSGAKKWGEAQRAMYANTGSVSLLNGFARHGYMGGNEPYNTPIQGTGARLVLDAQNDLAALARYYKDSYFLPRINIHDDLTFIVPEHPDIAEVYVENIVPELIKVRYPWQIIPLAVEVKAGKNWFDMEYVADFTGDYVK